VRKTQEGGLNCVCFFIQSSESNAADK